MGGKRTLNEEELDKIKELRERASPASWLSIEKQTGIPRAIAQREYEAYKKTQSIGELREIRLRLAEGELKNHFDILVRTGKAFAAMIYNKKLPVPIYSDGDTILEEDLFKADFLGPDIREDVTPWNPEPTNKIYFDSLSTHLVNGLGRDLVKEWVNTTNLLYTFLKEMRQDTRDIVENILDQEKNLNDLLEQLPDRKTKDNATFVLTNAVSGAIESSLYKVIDKYDEIAVLGIRNINCDSFMDLVKRDLERYQIASGSQLREKCDWAIKNECTRIGEEGLKKNMEYAIALNGVTNRLLDVLHPIKLRPLLLRTRCDICPIP